MKSKNCRDWGMLVVRILIGLLFIMAAVNKFQNIDAVAGAIDSTWLPAGNTLAWASAILELLGGLMIVLGIHANGAALILAAYVLITTLTFHLDFSDQGQTIQLLKNLAVIGGLLSLFFNGGGRFLAVKCKCCNSCGTCSTK